MKTIRIKRLRAHHVANLYFDFLRYDGELLSKDLGRFIARTITSGRRVIAEYPIEVIETTDPICECCREYPAINFCRGPYIREMDRKAAEKLGLVIGREYSKSKLLEMFESLKKKDGIRRRSNQLDDYIRAFQRELHQNI